MILFVLLVCAFAVATTEFVLVGLLPDIATDLSVSIPTVGALVTAYMFVVTIGGPIAAFVTRRLDRRSVLIASMTLALGSAALTAVAHSYGVLLAARLGSALSQSLFVAVASQVAMLTAAPERQTAAVARVFNGFAIATVAGLPLGTIIGSAYGWHATFVAVAVLCAAGLAGVIAFCPKITVAGSSSPGSQLTAMLRGRIIAALVVTLLAFTGFVAAFTYIAPMLRDLAGATSTGVTVALVVYGLGTVAGNIVGGRIPPGAIVRALPVPLAVLTAVLAAQPLLMRTLPTAAAGLFVLGASTFVVVPLVQTWIMRQVDESAAGVAAATNISVFGLAGALGAALGGAVIAGGLGIGALGPVAATAVLAATAIATVLRRTGREPRPRHETAEPVRARH